MTRSNPTETVPTSPAEREADAFLRAHVARLEPLSTAANLASWEAATTGAAEATARSAEARIELRRLYADGDAAREVRRLLAQPGLRDAALRRQLVLLDLAFTGNQLPDETLEELTRREAELERVFYTFRARLDGVEVSNNQLLEILRTERDGGRRREAWEAGKLIAREVAGPLRELVRRRNEAARSLGFENYYAMELALQEIDEEYLFSLLEEFRRRSEEPFAELRAEMDRALAARYGVATEELRPWHWEDLFSQEAPAVGRVDLDPLYAGRDPVEIARGYFARIDLPVDDVLARSDLYEREGKDQHAFCTDIDRAGDVRVLCNLRPNEKWMGTLLHELGHAAYDTFIPASLPYLLRTAAHTLTTESIAMLMGRLTRKPEWMRQVVGVQVEETEAADIRRQLRASMLVSARWMLVMAHFERELYRDPDRPDLDTLWWDLVERMQGVRRPEGRDEPDWAAKIHLSLSPVYYHNYLLGELMASQLTGALAAELAPGESAVASPRLGRFLRERVFAAGATLPWNELLAHATGEPLNPEHFVREFV